MVMLPWLCFTIGVCEMGLLLHSSCETPFFTKTFVETFTVQIPSRGRKHAPGVNSAVGVKTRAGPADNPTCRLAVCFCRRQI
jgi:hypothetical protein